MIPRLGVNIDHVATLRQARGEDYPSIVEAANTCLSQGADQITIHLREDRRHIQDTDVEAVSLVTQKYGKPLNFEMGCNQEIIEVALATAPEWICLVPEKRQEQTTEGGLDLIDSKNFDKVESTIQTFRSHLKQTKISLFIESDKKSIEKAIEFKVDAVEIHTGEFAKAFLRGDNLSSFYSSYQQAKETLNQAGIGCHAGHGLTYESVRPLLERKLFEEYNIGHWIICDSIFHGLGTVVRRMKNLFEAF